MHSRRLEVVRPLWLLRVRRDRQVGRVHGIGRIPHLLDALALQMLEQRGPRVPVVVAVLLAIQLDVEPDGAGGSSTNRVVLVRFGPIRIDTGDLRPGSRLGEFVAERVPTQ